MTIDVTPLLTAAHALSDNTQTWLNELRATTPPQPPEVIHKVSILDSLKTAFDTELAENENEPNELVILVEGYLQMTRGLYTFLLKSGKAAKNTVKNVREALTKLKEEAQNVKRSLLEDTSPENFFIQLLKDVRPELPQSVITETERLFNRERFALSDEEIVNLTKGWEAAIAQFISTLTDPSIATDAEKAEAEAGFLELHSSLEILYERLETNVTRTDEDILSPTI